MSRYSAAFLLFIAYGMVLVAVAVWAARRTHNAMDFFLARRRLGPWLMALSHVANATPAWMLLVIAGAAFTWGRAALWIWIAVVAGYAVNVFFVAPRLRLLSTGQRSTSFAQMLAAEAGDRFQPLVLRSAALMVFILFIMEIGAVLQLGGSLAGEFGFEPTTALVTVFIAIVAYTAVGGYWAASMTDAIQVGVLLVTLLFLPLLALVAAEGMGQLQTGFLSLGSAARDWFAGRSGVVAVAFAAGAMGLGLGLLGQPHALNRFMAAKDETVLHTARWIALACIVMLAGFALICGWCASVLYAGYDSPERVLFVLAERILPPWASAMMTAALLCAMCSGISNRLLVMASSLSADTWVATSPSSFTWARVVLVLLAIVALTYTLNSRNDFAEQTMLCFSALGAAFGPLLMVRLAGKRVRSGSTLGAMWAGFVLTVMFHALPDSPGDFLERVLPFVAALGIALSGGERRRNPDRADRSEETVHDRVPI